MIEKIGNVSLDLTYYPGEDFYCDGAVEDELLEIVKNNEPSEYARIIEEKKSWPILYHLSSLRENIIDWMPLAQNAKVLEIGAGCGAITGALARKAGTVTCIDLSKKRSSINAYRHKELENVTIKVGNFQDIEPSLECDYDYIFLIGVFEYAQAYINSTAPYEDFLSIVKKHAAKNGKIVIAIENKYGMKYFAGCREDHIGEFFTGIEDYPNKGVVRTFSRGGLEKVFEKCKTENYTFYYPYPDYKFMSVLYSDKRLPNPGELTNNLRNFDRSRMLLFDEKTAFDGVLKEGQFPVFSNSYLVVIGEEEDTVYSKFSNDRAAEYAIRTDIIQKNDGNWSVVKVPMHEAAKSHIDSIQKAKEALTDKYKDSQLKICDCKRENEKLIFPYLKGRTLEEILDSYLECEDMDNICRLLEKYYEFLSFHAEMAVTDLDFIFPNILIDGDCWQLIDYEWTESSVTDSSDIAKRALFCYMLGNERRKKLNTDLILQTLNVKQFTMEMEQKKEIAFQQRVTGKRKSLSQLRDLLHEEVLPLRDALMIYQYAKDRERMQIYWDCGQGFAEDNSKFVLPDIIPETAQEPEYCHVEIPLSENLHQVRLDPAMFPCLMTIKNFTLMKNGKEEAVPFKKLKSNGKKIGDNVYLFSDSDPNLTLPMKGDCRNTVLKLDYCLVCIPDKIPELMNWEVKGKLFG